jgi:hypothetical protein
MALGGGCAGFAFRHRPTQRDDARRARGGSFPARWQVPPIAVRYSKSLMRDFARSSRRPNAASNIAAAGGMAPLRILSTIAPLRCRATSSLRAGAGSSASSRAACSRVSRRDRGS